MTPKQLYMVSEDDGESRRLSTRSHYYPESRPAEPHEITLEAMADMLDHDAESANAHDFVMCHRALAALIHREAGREVATRVMRRLVDFDGLQGIVGVCGCGNPKETAKALGVPLDGWKKWRLEP